MPISESSYLGLRTVVYFVTDLKKATNWYAEVLGFKPYCDTPYYVGFKVGGFELGLHPTDAEPVSANASGIA